MINAAGTDELATLASRVYLRTLRISVPGALWQLVDSEPGCTTCTIIGRAWEVAPENLWRFNPVAALWAVRGGSGCISLLSSINYRLIQANPKILIGYSSTFRIASTFNKHSSYSSSALL